MSQKLKIALAQLSPLVGDVDKNISKLIKIRSNLKKDVDILVAPELYVSGYPIDDLVLRTRDRISEKVNREPIGYSFGSTFKNNSLPAWKCIEKIIESLDRNNNIFYSNKHYNWIINSNKGSGEDALDIIKQTQLLVEEKLNIYLENEVTII